MNLTGCFDLAEAASLAALIGFCAQTISATWRHGSAQPTPQPMRSNIATLNTVSLPPTVRLSTLFMAASLARY